MAVPDRSRSLVASGYALAFLLVVLPPLEVLLTAWPVRLADAGWRLGATGLLSRSLLMPALGLGIACGAARLLEQRRVLRTLAVLIGTLALALLLGIGLFSLDVLQLRRMVRPQALRVFDVTAVRAAVTLVVYAGVLAWIAIGSWKAAPARRRHRAGATSSTIAALHEATVR